MRERRASLRGAGEEPSAALDDAAASQGLSFWPRSAGVPCPFAALLAGLVLLGSVLGLAACGGDGGDEGKASPTAIGTGGLDLPSDLTDEQKAAVLQIKNLADDTEPLATLVSHKELAEDDIRAAIDDDAKFVELESLAKSNGFGAAAAGVEFQYDNDIKVTAAVLDSPEGGLALAMRESGASPAYLVVHVVSDGKTVTEYNSEGTVTLNVETLEGSAVDSPEAQHSCRVGHCIFAALTWLSDSWYGWLVGEICDACMESVVALPATAGASAVLSIPSCMACIPGLVAAGISSTIVCYDAPCSYCTDNSCGEPPRSHDQYCAWWIGERDPITGITASVTGADTGYYCDGITENWDGSEDYSESECRYSSESTGIVRPCPYGCADPPPGDTASRDCAPPSTCDPAICNGEQATGEPHCVHRAPPDNDIIKQDYDVSQCVPAIYPGGSYCQTTTDEREVQQCPFGCTPEGTSCAGPTQTTICDPATCNGDKPKGDPVCTTNPGGHTAEVTQQNERCSCQTVAGVSACVCAPIAPTIVPCALGCAADGKSCAGPGGSRGEGCEPSTCEQPDVPIGDPRCTFRPDDQQWIIERDYDHWECSPVQGGDDATCVEMTITKFEQACPNGCAADGKSCAAGPSTCDPALCTKEEPVGDPRCVLSPSGYIIEQPFDDYSCQDLPTGGSACLPRSATEVMENCPYGCAADWKSCASAGDLPAAPADFLALENPGGTYFEWTDNSSNEDGFKIYYGSKSLGHPSQLIATTGPDVQTLDTDFVRSGSEICWEIYAFNSAGESAPAWYCLPP
jgi:hypothetical protein